MKINPQSIKPVIFSLVVGVILVACGGGDSSNDVAPPASVPPSSTASTSESLRFESVSNDRVEVVLGETISMHHIVTASEPVTYTSSNYTIASVNPKTGEVFINLPGNATITARTSDWQSSAEYEVVVREPAEGSFFFPGAVLNTTLYDGPFSNWVVDIPPESTPVVYESSDLSVATVDRDSGLLTIVGTGKAVISAVRPADNQSPEQSAKYQLRVFGDEDIENRNVRINDSGTRIEVETTYVSGFTETELEWVGVASQFGTCLIEGVNRQAEVLLRNARSSDRSLYTDRCLAIEDISPQPDRRRLLEQAQLDQIFASESGFTPSYIQDHGNILETQQINIPLGTEITNVYQSGLVEKTQIESFKEDQTFYDYTGDGDRNDYILLTTFLLDGHLYRRHLRTTAGLGGQVIQDFGQVEGNVPRRVQMPNGYPNFLKINGDINNLRLHVEPAVTAGQYYVKLDKLDPTTKLLIFKQEGFNYIELRGDYFERTILVDNTDDVSYSIYAVSGDLYIAPLSSYPNFFVRYESENNLLSSQLKGALDRNKRIVEGANLDSFTEYYNQIRVEHDPYVRAGSHYFGGKVVLGGTDPYFERVLIHEVAHGYHENFVSNGMDNQEIIDLYNLVSHDLNVPYGDEKNSYWRTNQFEFFAELLTTYIYLSSSEGDDTFAITQVDSSFYYTYAKPYFDRLFE